MKPDRLTLAIGLMTMPTLTFAQQHTNAADTLIHDSAQIATVEVVAQKPVVKMKTDRMTYDVQQDKDAQSMTVLDILRKVPMVTVDAQDNITVNGSSSFKVLVDGKPNVQLQNNASQIFKVMPASAVKNIEVITNPGAKYDAEGVGGVLNITLNHQTGKNNERINSYGGEVSTRVSNISYGGSAYVGGQQGRLNYSLNSYGGYMENKGTTYTNEITQEHGDSRQVTTTTARGNRYMPYTGSTLSLGLELDSMSNINASIGFNHFSQRQASEPLTTLTAGNGGSYSYRNRNRVKSTGVNASADYQRFFNAEHTRSLVLSYQFSSSPNRTRDYRYYSLAAATLPFTLNDSYSDARTRATDHTVQVDYTTPMGQGQTLNVGAKYINHLNKSDASYQEYDEEGATTRTTLTRYHDRQQIVAGYAEHTATFGKWSSREGLRYEHTWQKTTYPDLPAQNFKKDYGNLVPSATLSYSLAPATNIGLTYALRIVRPGISYLNPYRDPSDPTQVTYGNPDLDVERSHNISLVFNKYSAKLMLNVTLSQSFCGNQIAQYTFTDADNRLNTTYGNNVKNRWTNLNAWARTVLGKKTSVMVNGYVGYGDIRSSQLDERNHGWQADGMVMLEQTLPWSVKWNTGLQASGKKYNLQGYTGGMSFAFTTLNKAFCNDRLNVSLFFMTPLADKLNIEMESRGAQFSNHTTIKVPIRMAQLSVTWKFGNTKRQFAQYQSKIKNDYGERKAESETINNMGTGQGM